MATDTITPIISFGVNGVPRLSIDVRFHVQSLILLILRHLRSRQATEREDRDRTYQP
jgi:hypothetical protein